MKKDLKVRNAMTLECVLAKQTLKELNVIVALKIIMAFRIAKNANVTKVDRHHSNACQMDRVFVRLDLLEQNVQNAEI